MGNPVKELDLDTSLPCHSDETDGSSDENNQHQLLADLKIARRRTIRRSISRIYSR
jgi:hypothetical protein